MVKISGSSESFELFESIQFSGIWVPLVTPFRNGELDLLALRQLSAHPRIQALKDCSGDADAARALIADGRLALFGGNDDEMFDQLARGAAGAFAASAHLCSADFVRLHRLIAAEHPAGARALWGSASHGLAAVTEALFAEPNPAVIKGLLARQGWMTDEVRAPMCVAARASVDRAEAVCPQVSRQLSWQVSQPIRAR